MTRRDNDSGCSSQGIPDPWEPSQLELDALLDRPFDELTEQEWAILKDKND